MFFAAFFALFVIFLYGPMIGHLHPVVPGTEGGTDLPDERVSRPTGSTHWLLPDARRRHRRLVPALDRPWPSSWPCSPWCCRSIAGLGFRRRFLGSAVVFYMAIASLIMPGLFVGLGIALLHGCSAGRPTGTRRVSAPS